MRLRSTLCTLTLLGLAASVSPAWSWVRDQNANKIDDALEAVQTDGLGAAYENGDVNARALFFVYPTDAPLTFGVYVGYDHAPTDADAAALTATGATVTWRPRYIDYIRARASYAQILALATQAGVTRIEAQPVLYATNDNASRTMRARDAAGGIGQGMFPSVWANLGLTGRGIVVGIIDTGVNDAPSGVYPGHESLRGKFVGGGDYSNPDAALNTPIDSSANPANNADPLGDYHGTHVAGTAIGTGGPEGIRNGAPVGAYAGMAPDARLVDLKALSDAGVGGGASEALEWCIAHKYTTWDTPGENTVYRGVQVVNMSLGALMSNSDGTEADCVEVNTAVKNGIVVCVATGNDGYHPGIATPAAADDDIAVGAFQDANTLQHSDDIVADFSNEGVRKDDLDADHVDEMKPSVLGDGSGIVSALGDPTTDGRHYHNINGTSMACPSVVGVCALIKQANPALSPFEVRTILQNTAEHRTDNGKQPPSAADPYGIDPNYHPSWGWGMPDAYAAVKEALNPNTTQVVSEGSGAVSLVMGHLQIPITWATQREIGVTGFTVWRAPDVGGAAGTFAAVSPSVTPVGHAAIERTSNRTPYTWTDADLSLVPGALYWYQVRWTDVGGGTHVEPAFRVTTEVKPTLARVIWSFAHNAPDNDLFVRYGSGTDINAAPFVRPTGGSTTADSQKVIVPVGFGAMIQYWFHQDLTEDDLVQDYSPPSAANPWFLSALEKGFVNAEGLVMSFSVTVYNGMTSTTYTAVNPPTATVEGQTTVFWIPADPVTSLNHNPVLDPIGNRTVPEGVPLSIAVHATDPDGNPITYSTTPPPAGATFSAPSATLSWTPAYGQAGTYSVSFRATDNAFPVAAADSERITITVTPRAPGSNTAPLLAPIGDQTVRAGTSLTLTVYATDTEADAITYAASPLPAGATFDAGTRMFSWPTAAGQDGDYLVTFRATDTAAAADSEVVRITVTPGIGQITAFDCEPDTTMLTGTIGTGANGEMSDIQYQPFTVLPGAIGVQGELRWTGAPAIDLDFYLLDADSNEVSHAASLSDPEIVLVVNLDPGSYIWKIVSFTNPNPMLEYSITSIQCFSPTAVGEDVAGMRLALAQNAPNPFTGATAIRFTLPQQGPVSLRVMDATGRLVATLVDGPLPAGTHQRAWDGRGTSGRRVAPGVYFYRLLTQGGALTRKLVMLR